MTTIERREVKTYRRKGNVTGTRVMWFLVQDGQDITCATKRQVLEQMMEAGL